MDRAAAFVALTAALLAISWWLWSTVQNCPATWWLFGPLC